MKRVAAPGQCQAAFPDAIASIKSLLTERKYFSYFWEID
jgi:hypothetical protein